MAKRSDLYECIDGFVTPEGIVVGVGDLAEHGAEIMKNRDWAFRPFSGARFKAKVKDEGVEQATAAPGEKREKK